MKKIVKLILIIPIFLLIIACDSNITMKNEYYINEEAKIDDIIIKMTSIKDTDAVSDKQVLEITFELTNQRKNTITIDADTSFKLYDINKVQIPNVFQNSNNLIKKDQTIIYTLQYETTKKELYEILFYSGIVENNIKFVIRSSDIK